jgi:hypothetical protein
MRILAVSIVAALLIILTPTTSFAWNYAGHRVIASIAYRQLDDQTKRKTSEILKKHPVYADLSENRPRTDPTRGPALQ